MTKVQISSHPPANDAGRSGGSEPPRSILTASTRRRAMRQSRTTLLHLTAFMEHDEDRGIGALIVGMDGIVQHVNTIASDLLGIPEDVAGEGVSFIRCLDLMSRQSRIMRELQVYGVAFQVPTRIHADPNGTTPSDWIVTVRRHDDVDGRPLAHYVTLIDNAESAALAGTDALTGLANRRTFTQEIAREFGACNRHDQPLSLAYIDVDRFKRFNDEHGHDAGDIVLKAVADSLAETVRATDIPCRIGGEEFAIILPQTDSEGACVLAEKLREAVERRTVEYLGTRFSVTISVGVSTYRLGDKSTVATLVTSADHAMLEAKESGRNNVRLAKASVAA